MAPKIFLEKVLDVFNARDTVEFMEGTTMAKIKVGSTVKSNKGQVGKVFEVDRASQAANANGQPDVVIMCDGQLVWLLGTEYTLENK